MSNSIDSIFESARVNIQNRAFTLRESERYRKFTETFVCRSGDLVLANFHGIYIEYKARIKSLASTSKKVKKNASDYARQQVSSAELIDVNDFNLYDIYGGKIVVLSITDNFYSDFITIDGFLNKREKCRNYWEEAKSIASKFPESEDKQEIARLNYIIYREVDSMCQRYISDAICDFIINNPTLKEEFGIYTIANRMREYNSKNEYIARHITLASKELPGWYMELQFKSFRDYEVARTGDAAHHMRNGKEIDIPTSLDGTNFDTVPSYMVYIPTGQLYIPTPYECLYHQLEPVADANILKNLFKIFPEESGTFKKL